MTTRLIKDNESSARRNSSPYLNAPLAKRFPSGFFLQAFGTALILCFLSIILSPSTSIARGQIDTLKKVQKQQEQKLKRLKKNISRQETIISTNKTKAKNLYDELTYIDTNLINKQETILVSQENLIKQESFLQAKELELDLLLKDKQRTETHIKNRLKSFYKMGDIGFFNTLFSASTLPELLNTQEYFRSLFQYDRLAMKKYKTKIALLKTARKELITGKEKLLQSIVTIKKQEKELIAARQDRLSLLKRIKTEEKLYNQALNEMQKSASHLTERFNKNKRKMILSEKKKRIISDKERIRKQSQAAKNSFAAQKGKLPSPVSDGTVTTYFGKSKSIFGAELNSNGIDIEIKNDTEVKSIYKGVTVYAGSLKDYGNLVIIDHGQQYYSLASQMSKLTIQKGEAITQGQTIGILTADQSGLLHKGLHFEIRKGSKPIDPLKWINKKQLTLKLTQ